MLPAVDAEELAMEGISGHGCRLPFTGYLQRGLGSVEDSVVAKAASGASVKRQGCQRHGMVRKCMEDNPIREPELPAEADLCAVKRKVPQSLSPGRKAWGGCEAQVSERCWEHERREYS